jgi:hypothetical protein
MSIFSSIVIFHLSFLKLGQIPNSVTKHWILVLTNVWSLRAKKTSEKTTNERTNTDFVSFEFLGWKSG